MNEDAYQLLIIFGIFLFFFVFLCGMDQKLKGHFISRLILLYMICLYITSISLLFGLVKFNEKTYQFESVNRNAINMLAKVNDGSYNQCILAVVKTLLKSYINSLRLKQLNSDTINGNRLDDGIDSMSIKYRLLWLYFKQTQFGCNIVQFYLIHPLCFCNYCLFFPPPSLPPLPFSLFFYFHVNFLLLLFHLILFISCNLPKFITNQSTINMSVFGFLHFI